MIAGLRGTLEAVGSGWAVVGVGGVSIKVNLPTNAVSELGPPGSPVRLHTSLVVREDSLALYGFLTVEALRLFELLLGVTGVGPRVALGILSGGTPEAIALAIVSGDLEALTRIPGVGKKTASRVTLELKGKLEREWGTLAEATPDSQGEVVAALMALGYSTAEARGAIAELPRNASLPLEERVRQALQHLGKRV
ncbi:MAG: Holliday junction branch migration protein RuvA [Chloroflexi bacterium]|nr:Holliday junction branch migration protein RuvA [Chloroflexota bacterium]